MYVEVRRHPELREVFQGGAPFPIVDTLRELAAGPAILPHRPTVDEPIWFWIAFALGLAQLSALADARHLRRHVDVFRRQFATDPRAPAAVTPSAPDGSGS